MLVSRVASAMRGGVGMEFRQLRYFVTLTEELNFGRAAAREHIVQSALSQQLQRLERELGVRLLERTTHHVRLTPAGTAFLREARQIIAHVGRATVAAQRAAGSAPGLRVGIVDASYDSMPQILRQVRQRYPDLEIHEVETGVPQQLKLLVDGGMDVGLGRASLAPPEIATELFRLDPLGVLVHEGHHLAALSSVPVAALAAEPMLLAEEGRAPEFNQFVIELCRSVGFVPTVYRGTVESIRAATELVIQGRCVVCAPASCVSAAPGMVWRPLVEPISRYPWSVLWRANDRSEHVSVVVAAARDLSQEFGWLEPPREATG
jgi:DNA-binding transcriptional LysR family regulator